MNDINSEVDIYVTITDPFVLAQPIKLSKLRKLSELRKYPLFGHFNCSKLYHTLIMQFIPVIHHIDNQILTDRNIIMLLEGNAGLAFSN